MMTGGLSTEERHRLASRARRRWYLLGLVGAATGLAAAAVAGAAVPGRPHSSARVLLVGAAALVLLVLVLGVLAVLLRQRTGPALAFGTDRRTQAAVRRALRDGHAADPRIDELARDSAARTVRLRWALWLFAVGGVLDLAGVALLLADGARDLRSLLADGLLLVILALAGGTAVANYRRSRRYLNSG